MMRVGLFRAESPIVVSIIILCDMERQNSESVRSPIFIYKKEKKNTIK